AGRVEQAAGEVGGLLHERGVRRALDDVGHLLDGALQVVPENLQSERVQSHQACLRMIRLPKRSTSPTWPPGTSTVVSGCSTMAGPASCAPRPSAALSKTCARVGRPSSQIGRVARATGAGPTGVSAIGNRGRSARSWLRRL